MVRKQCEARADYYRLQNSINQKMAKILSENDALNSENQHLNCKLQDLKNKNMEKDILTAHLKAQLVKNNSSENPANQTLS